MAVSRQIRMGLSSTWGGHLNYMKGIIATRFSDPKQIGGTSTDTQVDVCDRYCRESGIEIIGYHKVEAESAKSSNVARIAELLDFCRKYEGRAKVLVVFKIDRFARDVSQHYYLKTELLKVGISLRSATEPIDDTPQGELMETILAGFAQFDNSVKRERVKLAMWKRVEQGLWPWNPPTGYKPNRIEGIKLTPHVFDETCSDVIKGIFTKFSTGVVTYSDIAKDLRKRRIKNHRGKVIKFSKQMICWVLNNPYYVGLIKNQEEKLVKGLHEPLIEVSLFEKCKDIQDGVSRHNTRQRVYNNPDFPLRRFAICGECGKPMTACWAKSGTHPYYYCINKSCFRYSKMIKKTDFENLFMEYLKIVKPKEKTIKRFETRFIKRYKERETEIKGDYVRQLNDTSELQKELDWVVDSGRKGILPEHIVKDKVNDLDQKITLAKLQLTEIHTEELNVNALLAYAESFIRTLENSWFDARPNIKLRLQRAIFPEGVTYKENVFSNSRISPAFEIISTFGAENVKDVTPLEFESKFSE